MNNKLAIIMAGGGMKSSFGVGVILALAKKYNLTEPFLMICDSGSAGTGSYYISKQYDSIYNIWTNLVSSKKFVNLKRFWKIIDIDYLIDDIFKKQDKLKVHNIYTSNTRYLISALNEDTGEIDYFDNWKDMDVFESMRATKAMPIAFKMDPKVKIHGHSYCDSPISSAAESHIKKAVEMGAKKILIVDNSIPEKNVDGYIFDFWMWFHKCKKRYHKIEFTLEHYKVPKDIEILTILPKDKLKISVLNNNKELLERTIKQGYDETLNNQELKEFLI